jgi:hypothetical protein
MVSSRRDAANLIKGLPADMAACVYAIIPCLLAPIVWASWLLCCFKGCLEATFGKQTRAQIHPTEAGRKLWKAAEDSKTNWKTKMKAGGTLNALAKTKQKERDRIAALSPRSRARMETEKAAAARAAVAIAEREPVLPSFPKIERLTNLDLKVASDGRLSLSLGLGQKWIDAEAATIVQSRMRVKLAKEEKQRRLQRKAEEDEAATVLQSAFRGKKGRRDASVALEEKEEHDAATVIQSKTRGKKATKVAKKKKQAKKEDDAATTVQAGVRAKSAKADAAKRKQKKIEDAAATVIQAHARAKVARFLLKELKRQRMEIAFNRLMRHELVRAMNTWYEMVETRKRMIKAVAGMRTPGLVHSFALWVEYAE